jgi:hypothetical protein
MSGSRDFRRRLIGDSRERIEHNSMPVAPMISETGHEHVFGRLRIELQDEVLFLLVRRKLSVFVEVKRHVLIETANDHDSVMLAIDFTPVVVQAVAARVICPRKPLVIGSPC